MSQRAKNTENFQTARNIARRRAFGALRSSVQYAGSVEWLLREFPERPARFPSKLTPERRCGMLSVLAPLLKSHKSARAAALELRASWCRTLVGLHHLQALKFASLPATLLAGRCPPWFMSNHRASPFCGQTRFCPYCHSYRVKRLFAKLHLLMFSRVKAFRPALQLALYEERYDCFENRILGYLMRSWPDSCHPLLWEFVKKALGTAWFPMVYPLTDSEQDYGKFRFVTRAIGIVPAGELSLPARSGPNYEVDLLLVDPGNVEHAVDAVARWTAYPLAFLQGHPGRLADVLHMSGHRARSYREAGLLADLTDARMARIRQEKLSLDALPDLPWDELWRRKVRKPRRAATRSRKHNPEAEWKRNWYRELGASGCGESAILPSVDVALLSSTERDACGGRS